MSTVPDRVSVERGDPGFEAYEMLGERRFAMKVLLDGVEQNEVMTADASQRWLRRFVKRDGLVVTKGNRLLTEVVKGRVEFIF